MAIYLHYALRPPPRLAQFCLGNLSKAFYQVLVSDFFRSTIGQHFEHDLCSELEGVGKSFDVSQDTYLSLGILKVRKELAVSCEIGVVMIAAILYDAFEY